METRTIKVTLETAKYWYNSDNDTLKAIALDAFTKQELEKSFENIKCFEDVLNTLSKQEIEKYEKLQQLLDESQIAIIKLQLIRRVLNLGYNMEKTSGMIYYPYNPIITQECNTSNNDTKQRLKEITQITMENKKYTLLGDDTIANNGTGLLDFLSYTGGCFADSAFLGCATAQIAKHMSLYFAKEIFDAKYKGWIDYEYSND